MKSPKSDDDVGGDRMSGSMQDQLTELNRLYKESEEIYRQLAQKLGIGKTAFWILYAVSHVEGEVTQYELCKDWSYPMQTINSAIGKLQQHDILRLEEVPSSKRRKKILLTDKGLELCNQIVRKVDEIEHRAFQRFTEGERKTYLSLYRRHLDALRDEEQRTIDMMGEGVELL